MRIYDVTKDLSESSDLYPGDPPTVFCRISDIELHDPFTLTSFSMGAHAGTHIDAPSHLIRGGITIDEIPLSTLIGPVQVLTVTNTVDIQSLMPLNDYNVPRVLLKTEGSNGHLTADVAEWIIKQGVKLIGVDAVSVDPPGEKSLIAHHILLGAGVIIVEGLDLTKIHSGLYNLFCLPLKLKGVEGAPARVVLTDRDVPVASND